MKTIRTRRWVTKSGEVRVKTYEYDKVYKPKRGGRTKLLVSKRGGKYTVITKNKEAAINAIMNDNSLSLDEKITTKNALLAQIKDAIYENRKLTVRSAESMMAVTKVEKFIINLGYEVGDLAEELKVSETDLLNPNNWSNDTFSVSGKSWKFKFKYEGTAYYEVND